ncbi:MAG TPA: preprotein translocase subunit YajC [Phycisphaerae bacterium]|nr:preprotein translocase subunit YajC [Phycisphaerae bacterium]HNU43792.1 preprotein translocase subunit YajC [Phycisphaerae bacterium]
MNLFVRLLADVAPSTPSPAPNTQPASPFGGGLFIAMMLALLVFMVMSSRSQRKREQRKREELYNRLAKNDRVLTVGGAIGTIVSVKDNEVVVKVDESTNTKMTFLKTAIQRVITDETDLTAEQK